MKKKEELAEGLHLIDFEQLKIENQVNFYLIPDPKRKDRVKKWGSSQTEEKDYHNGSDFNPYKRKACFRVEKPGQFIGYIGQTGHWNSKNENIDKWNQR